MDQLAFWLMGVVGQHTSLEQLLAGLVVMFWLFGVLPVGLALWLLDSLYE